MAEEGVVDGWIAGVLGDPQAGCGVALRLAAAANASEICPNVAAEILRGMAEAKKGLSRPTNRR